MFLYRRESGTGIVHLVGTAGTPSVTDEGANRTWTWTASFSAAGLPAQAGAPIFAVGTTAAGAALQSQDNPNISIVGVLP